MQTWAGRCPSATVSSRHQAWYRQTFFCKNGRCRRRILHFAPPFDPRPSHCGNTVDFFGDKAIPVPNAQFLCEEQVRLAIGRTRRRATAALPYRGHSCALRFLTTSKLATASEHARLGARSLCHVSEEAGFERASARGLKQLPGPRSEAVLLVERG